MSRWARRVDASHGVVAETLKRLGLSVRDLSRQGSGCPDLAVSFGGRTSFVEVKTPHTQYGKRLSAQQLAWLDGWEGEHVTLRTPEDAVAWALGFKQGGHDARP